MNNLTQRKNLRLKNYDYSSNGYYFVTICCYQKRQNIDKYKNLVKEVLTSLPARFNGLSIDYYILMPNHLHIIFVFNETKIPLFEIIRTFKSLVSRETKEKNFWQRNYFEHVIRDEKALKEIREYIQNNPEAEITKIKELYKKSSGLMNQAPTQE